MKKYKIVPTKRQFAQLKQGWKLFQAINDAYYESISDLEGKLTAITGIEVEFFFCDNSCVGIGNGTRDMALIQRDILEL